MSEANTHKAMIRAVAQALGDEFLADVAFVGGCTTSLFITDDFSREQVRHTNDVDLIIHVLGYAQWAEIQQKLRSRGFKDIVTGSAPVCALELGGLRVDFMPDDERLLGFANRWYADALATAEPYSIDEETVIRLVTPPYFVATKLEAYKGRGGNDPLGSQDVEDLLNLFEGRAVLLDELSKAPDAVKQYIAQELQILLKNPGMSHAVEGNAWGQESRAEYLYEVLGAAAALGN